MAIAAAQVVQLHRAAAAAGDAPLVVILQHTRELAAQTAAVVTALAQYTAARVVLCVGGTPTAKSAADVAAGCDIVVATLGRLTDLVVRRNSLRMDGVKLLVIDEVDEVLRESNSNAFLGLVQQVMAAIPPEAQVALFSATLPSQLLQTTTKFMRDPVRMLQPAKELPLRGIEQRYVAVTEDRKYDELMAVIALMPPTQTIVFCSTRERVDELALRMSADRVPCSVVHAGLDSRRRTETMAQFRAGQVRVLVCTELLARGVDVQQVGLVILYDMCNDADTYMHCVGRCGRFGRKGQAVTLANEFDLPMLRSVGQIFAATITELATPAARPPPAA